MKLPSVKYLPMQYQYKPVVSSNIPGYFKLPENIIKEPTQMFVSDTISTIEDIPQTYSEPTVEQYPQSQKTNHIQHVIKQGVKLSDEAQKILDAASRFGVALRVTSGVRPGAKTNKGKTSLHSVGKAIDITPIPGQSWEDLKHLFESTGFGKGLEDNGYKIIEEVTKADQKKYGASGPNWHIGYHGVSKAKVGLKIYNRLHDIGK